MNLYYITGSDETGFNCSLFVYAETPDEAFQFWKDHEVGKICLYAFHNVLSTKPAVAADENDLRIFQLPLGPTSAGAIDWHQSHGVECVAFAEEF